MADMAEANRKHWDSKAREYDTKPWQQKMIGYIVSQLEEQREFFGLPKEQGANGEFRLLDYACGPGTMSKALSRYATSTQGIDVSDSMVTAYNGRASTGLLPPNCSAAKGNLLTDEPYIFDPSSGAKDFAAPDGPAYSGFDACIVGLGFHHFDRYAAALEQLAQRVRKGGVVGIVDLFQDQAHDDALTEEMRASMHKSGFVEEEMKGYMAEAGLVDFALVELGEPVVMEIHGKDITRRLFFARGRKA